MRSRQRVMGIFYLNVIETKSWQFLAAINLVLAIVILQTHCNLTSVEIGIETDAKKAYSKNTIQRR